MDTKRTSLADEYDLCNMVGVQEVVASDGQLVKCAGCGKVHIRSHGLGHMIRPFCNDCVDQISPSDEILLRAEVEEAYDASLVKQEFSGLISGPMIQRFSGSILLRPDDSKIVRPF